MSYKSAIITAIVTALADCAAFRTLVGAANQAAALAWIVAQDGGDAVAQSGVGQFVAQDGTVQDLRTADALNPHAVVIVGQDDAEQITHGFYRLSGSAVITLYMPAPDSEATEPANALSVAGTVGQIAEELRALSGAAAGRPFLTRVAVSDVAPVGTATPSPLRGGYVATITATWTNIPS